MLREGGSDDLSRWLSGDGKAALDGVTSEALDVIGVIDRELIVRYVNWTVPGLTRDTVVGNSVLDLVPPDYRSLARDTYLEVFRTGKGTRFETMYADAGKLLIWDVRVGPIRANGAVIGLIAITTNVTEQRREQADRDRFFSLSLDMLAVLGPDGRFKRVNPAFGETLGYSVSELVGMFFADLVHPGDRAVTLTTFANLLRGQRVFDFENRCSRKDGEPRVFSWRATVDPLTGDVYAVARDITAQRAVESQFRQAQKMDAIGKLAGGIAHDFNNLLLAILANVELAKANIGLSDETAAFLGEIEGAGIRAASLTNQLLAFSRRQPLRPAIIDLNELIRGLTQMLRRLLPENITINTTTSPELAAVNADATQIEQVVVNLCVNARDAMDSGGRLAIETKNFSIDDAFCQTHPWARPGRFVLLTVSDTGVGMTAEVREHMFEPFFTTKDVHHGTGLGLSTVYGIVQQHGGMLQVSSEVGKGSKFDIYLPADKGLAIDKRHDVEATDSTGRETILFAEDEPRIRKVVVEILERAGYKAISAGDGREAVRLLRDQKEPVHLVLLDVVMPELGGPDAWEQMRALQPGLRVIFTTGYADDRYLARLPPRAEVIGKPFRPDELLKRIRAKLDE